MAVPLDVMHHVVRVESSYNPYAIGVVGGRLVRQPKSLPEALATVQMLEQKGYNFSLGLAQVNRYNLVKYGLPSYERAFQVCANLQAGSRILAECYGRSGKDWGKSFSCYYSGDFQTGFRHGYVQKIYTSIRQDATAAVNAYGVPAIPLVVSADRTRVGIQPLPPRIAARMDDTARAAAPQAAAAPSAATASALGRIDRAEVRPYDAADVESRPGPAPPRDIILATRSAERSADLSGSRSDVSATVAGIDPNAVVRLADLQQPPVRSDDEQVRQEKSSSGVVDGAFVF